MPVQVGSLLGTSVCSLLGIADRFNKLGKGKIKAWVRQTTNRVSESMQDQRHQNKQVGK